MDILVRKAEVRDAQAVLDLIESYAKRGEMLSRPLSEIYGTLRDFSIYEEDGRILAVSAMHVCWEDLGEIRSLAVSKSHLGRGIGSKLVQAALSEARALGLKRVFALTYQEAFFIKLGFHEIDKDELPHKIWGDCIKCVKFPNCDETAVMIEL